MVANSSKQIRDSPLIGKKHKTVVWMVSQLNKSLIMLPWTLYIFSIPIISNSIPEPSKKTFRMKPSAKKI